jgi:15-cis-phytoene synthase
MDQEKEIFKQGSTTYYWSSKFFPEAVRDDVFKLYSFVRVADNFVDQIPQDTKSFTQLEQYWLTGKKPKQCDPVIERVVTNMQQVSTKYSFNSEWTIAFLKSMRMDLESRTYKKLDDTLDYIYGSAEVIGLMMAKIMGLPESSFEAARYQGRAMQYINFIRDIDEDIQLGRQYFPLSELKKYGLSELTAKSAHTHPAAYREFIAGQLAYYNEWQLRANTGFKAIPYALRVPLRTAVDMYNWTARRIAKNPFIVFDKKVKPNKVRVVLQIIKRSLYA